MEEKDEATEAEADQNVSWARRAVLAEARLANVQLALTQRVGHLILCSLSFCSLHPTCVSTYHLATVLLFPLSGTLRCSSGSFRNFAHTLCTK